ncbi:uncharacterized protein TRAVEDRAFT_59958, partial [Trametes versicolor FP-101664 SS1]|uniref:uncharacterized protein n=1 Tax=Trametes versicolor (strain FP-101664) TaxID=717944 RepID=UPI000462122C
VLQVDVEPSLEFRKLACLPRPCSTQSLSPKHLTVTTNGLPACVFRTSAFSSDTRWGSHLALRPWNTSRVLYHPLNPHVLPCAASENCFPLAYTSAPLTTSSSIRRCGIPV